MKSTKAASLDGGLEEMLKNGGISIIEWLLRVFKRCMETGTVLKDWKVTCILPIYKGKEDRREFGN